MPAVIFGDVHGCARQLRELIARARNRFGAGPLRFYSLGDLIDRGPDSREVIEVCTAEGVEGILGNHDLWLCSVLTGRPMNDGPYSSVMGGLVTLRSYGVGRGDPDHVGPAIRRAVPKAHQRWLLALPPARFIVVAGKKYALLHAGITSGMRAEVLRKVPEASDEDVVEIMVNHATNAFFWTGPNPADPPSVARFDSFVQVFGHTPTSKAVHVPGHYVALDTGAGTVPPYQLSAVVLLDDGRVEFLSVG